MKKITSTLFIVLLCVEAFASGHTVTISATNAACNGACNGTATATVSGGVGSFVYSWVPFGGTAAIATNLCAGSYTVTVTDINDMSTAAATLVISEPPLLIATASSTNTSSCGACDGTATLGVSGGTPPYQYTWSPGGIMTQAMTGLCSGSYTITLTDSHACTSNSTTSISSVALLITNPTPICSPGTIDITAAAVTAGSIGSGILSYWTDAATTMTLTSPSAVSISGTYYIKSTSGTCSDIKPVTVTISPFSFSDAGPNITMCSGLPMQIGAPATPAYSYLWSPSTGLTSATLSNPISNLTNSSTVPITTTYALTTTNTATGCFSIDSVNVTVRPAATVNAGASQTICQGSSVTLSGAVGGSATSGTWSGGLGTYAPNNNTLNCVYTPTSSEITSGFVILSLTTDDPIGPCPPSMSQVTITFIPLPYYVNFTMVPDSTNGLNYFAFNSTLGSGLTYTWSFGDGVSSALQSPSHLFSSAGTYTVTLWVANATGCVSSVSHTITVNATPATCLSLFNIAFDTTSTDPYAYTVYNLSYGSTLNYLWNFGDLSTSTLQNPTHVYNGTGPYQLCLTVDNGSGCVQTYCDSLMYVDSLSRAINQLSITVVNVSPFATGIQKYSLNSSIEVKPNPFSDNTIFEIQTNKINEVYSFELTDVLGKKVKSMNEISAKQFTISRNGLENGIYFYKIYSAKNLVSVGKLIVN